MEKKISSEQLSKIDYVITLSKKLIKLPSYKKKVIYVSHGLSHFFYDKNKILKNKKYKKK